MKLMRTLTIALAHAIGGILILGYSMEYYFHLRKATLIFLVTVL
jgi:ABC-type iron transport system FetAB permease component